jgi:hypothetical protein
MLIMRATDEAFAEFANVDLEQVIEAMGRFNHEMIQAGVVAAKGSTTPRRVWSSTTRRRRPW